MKRLVVTAGLVILIPSMASALPMDCAKYKSDAYKPSYCDPTNAAPKKAKIKEHYERLPPRPGYPRGVTSPPAPPGYYDRDDGDDFLDKINPLNWFGDNSGGGLPGEETTKQVLTDPLGVTDRIISDPIGSSKMFNPLDD